MLKLEAHQEKQAATEHHGAGIILIPKNQRRSQKQPGQYGIRQAGKSYVPFRDVMRQLFVGEQTGIWDADKKLSPITSTSS